MSQAARLNKKEDCDFSPQFIVFPNNNVAASVRLSIWQWKEKLATCCCAIKKNIIATAYFKLLRPDSIKLF